MQIEELYKLEIEGVVKTIQGYAVDHFILSYSKQLMEFELPTDNERVKVIINRLLEWYINNINVIEKSIFVMNKADHKKSMVVLKELHDLLEM